MTDIIRLTAVFIRANAGSAEAVKAADALADMTEGSIPMEEAVYVISGLLNRELEVRECVPNAETAFVLASLKELRKALHDGSTGSAYDIADILQALPEKEYLSDKKAVSAFNRTYIIKFNKKHGTKLPLIV
ncbi:MAG: hypothetical protein IKW96_03665 [Ruminococcus sp.]|uniref:hypothetical protein n=1 Tax=Ruminococcus sp. TaxID=41978 RepID=UPI0025CC3780|nr:hypothetical protein [Ruminococcus sp.]MBR5682367.1 hypothetical protein [Ruminococcus sp.]